jgi:UDP-N-acetylmuramoyl-tripeptide--D-alanyl-D-alanine ligase
MLTAELICELIGATPPLAPLPRATGVAFHSGRVRPGDAFFALPGASEHGIGYAAQALSRGASFIISDRPHPRGVQVSDPARALLALGSHARSKLVEPVIAISGSAGKTSTKAFVTAAVDGRGSPGNFNTPLALACTLVDAWLDHSGRPLVLELGIDHPGEMDQLLDLVRPSHGILTAIGESHLERLGSIEGVAREKARLLERSPERLASTGAAKLLPRPLAGLVRYGIDSDAHVSGETAPTGQGQRLSALGVSIDLPYPGSAMAENALAALAIAWRLGLDLGRAGERTAAARLEPGRLERKHLPGRILLDDSYNSNPASARRALEVLMASPAPRVAVLGDMLELGEHAQRLHRELGALTKGLDLVLAVGPLSRNIAAVNPAALHVSAVDEALPLLQRLPQGGTVLVKGSRGMRLERLVAALEEAASPDEGAE